MRTSVPTSPSPLTENSGAPVARGRVTVVHAGWRSVVKRVITCTACAMTVSSLLLPNVTWAAEWVNVEGVQYDTAHDGGSWAWDGANDLTLNNYTGGPISAAGELNVAYSGANAVAGTGDGGITVKDGENEAANLAITNNGEGSLTVTDENNSAIYSEGDISISGSGTVEVKGHTEDWYSGSIWAEDNINISGSGTVKAANTGESSASGIYSDGDMNISGSGSVKGETQAEYGSGIFSNGKLNVNSTGVVEGTAGDDGEAGIYANGEMVVADAGKIIAKSGGYGIYTSTSLAVSGGGRIEAVGRGMDGIYSSGDLTISGGTTVDATSAEYRGMYATDTLKVEGGSVLTVSSNGDNGITSGYDNIIVDSSTVRVNAVNGNAINAEHGAVVIRNGSLVEALATASDLPDRVNTVTGIYSGDERDEEDKTTASIDISNSTVKATSHFAPEFEREGKLSIGMHARSTGDDSPASIAIDRSNVTASGDDLGILAEHGTRLGDDVTVKPQGTIRITDCNIVVPGNGQIVDVESSERWNASDGELRGYDYCGQTIASGEENAPTVVIKTPEEPAPTPTPEPSEKPADTVKPAAASAKPAAAKAASKVTADLPQTGDHASLMVATLGAVGVAALAIGAAVLRRRLS